MLLSFYLDLSAAHVAVVCAVVGLATVLARVVYNLYFHPLAGFPGPWYAAATSLSAALISLRRVEPEWLMGLVAKYGSDRPIRIAPTMLLFPRASNLKDIYNDPACNLKSELYGTGALGPPNLFSTQDGARHRRLRKVLGGNHWSIGSLKKNWEPRIDDLVNLFTRKMGEFADEGEEVVIGDKVAEFAADMLTMLSFTDPWGFVRNSRDERAFLQSFRAGLNYFGMACRWRWYRNTILKNSVIAPWFLPSTSDTFGVGYLLAHADKAVTQREKAIAEGSWKMEKPDFLQHALDARYDDGSPLTPAEKRAQATLLIQAGADTTGTALGCTLRHLLADPRTMRRVRDEIEAADQAGKLSRPIGYEESRTHLPYFSACVKESLRLHPSAPNQFARVAPKGGKCIGNDFIPSETEITTNPYVCQRDSDVYGPDPEAYRPERWLNTPRASEMEAGMFVFGAGPRVCIGKDIAMMELLKLIPEVIRTFDFELLDIGQYVVAGGVAFNQNLRVRLTRRSEAVL